MQFIKLVFFFIVLSFLLSACASQSFKIKSYAPSPERGVTLSGTIIKPEGNGPFPGVVFLHGCSGIVGNEYEWASRLKKWGYATYILNSFGGRGVSDVCKSRKVSFLERALDAHAAKVQFGNLPFIDEDRVGVMGYSHGAGTILQAVDSSLAVYTLPEEAREPFKAAVALYPYCRFPVKTNTHTLILIGEKDDWTPASLCEMNKPKPTSADIDVVLKIYPGTYHKFDDSSKMTPKFHLGHYLSYSSSAMKDAVPRVKDFFDRNL